MEICKNQQLKIVGIKKVIDGYFTENPKEIIIEDEITDIFRVTAVGGIKQYECYKGFKIVGIDSKKRKELIILPNQESENKFYNLCDQFIVMDKQHRRYKILPA